MLAAQSKIKGQNLQMSSISVRKSQILNKSTIRANMECSICSMPISQYTRKIFTCNHNDICTSCQNDYVSSSLDQQNLPKCTSTSQKCAGTIKHQDEIAMNMLKISVRDRLLQRIRSKQLKNNKKCPTPDCPGFINRGTCNLCLVTYCESCYSPEHLGTCKIEQEQLPEGVKRCPNCGEGIQRDGGCLRMKCARPSCEYQFCFHCLDKWSMRHHSCGGSQSILDAINNFFRQLIG